MLKNVGPPAGRMWLVQTGRMRTADLPLGGSLHSIEARGAGG